MRRRLSTRVRRSARLELRPFNRRDTDAVYDAIRSSIAELNQWLPWARMNYSRVDVGAFLRESQSAWHDGRAYDFAVRRIGQPSRHVGNVSVWWTSRAAMAGEVGYWMRTDEIGRGLATEAAARVLGVAFDELGMHRVVLRIAVGNTGSERVAEKLGFAREGLLREEVKVNDVWLDHEFRANHAQYVAAGWL
jgi:RimJ/RimL family protein N-acetyltransferase